MSDKHGTKPSGNPWQQLLDEMASEQTGPSFFLKVGKTRIRLVAEPGTEDSETPTFFAPVKSTFRGKERIKYLLSAVVLSAEGREIPEDKQNRVIPVVVPKGVLQDILGALAEGWDLFDPETGHGISITKTGSGLGTEYACQTSPKPVPLPEGLQPMEMTMAEAAVEFMRISAERAAAAAEAGGDEDGEAEEAEAPARGKKAGKGGKSAGGGW